MMMFTGFFVDYWYQTASVTYDKTFMVVLPRPSPLVPIGKDLPNFGAVQIQTRSDFGRLW